MAIEIIPESIELGVDPTTALNATTLDHPSSLEQVRDYIEKLKDELASENPPSSQYLLVRRIPAGLFTTLVEKSELIKGVTGTFLHDEHEILYKITASFHHGVIVSNFTYWFFDVLSKMGLHPINRDYWLGGAGQMTGRRSNKEPDNCFFPGRFPAAGEPIPWPSFVLEVGISESLPQLRTDARWWYSNSDHQTQLMVLVSANSNSRDADIEIWTPVITRGQSTHVLECTKSASLRNGVVSGDALELDFQTLMGRAPQSPQETDLQLTPHWIQFICG